VINPDISGGIFPPKLSVPLQNFLEGFRIYSNPNFPPPKDQTFSLKVRECRKITARTPVKNGKGGYGKGREGIRVEWKEGK
jgi:hypothetical protein